MRRLNLLILVAAISSTSAFAKIQPFLEWKKQFSPKIQTNIDDSLRIQGSSDVTGISISDDNGSPTVQCEFCKLQQMVAVGVQVGLYWPISYEALYRTHIQGTKREHRPLFDVALQYNNSAVERGAGLKFAVHPGPWDLYLGTQSSVNELHKPSQDPYFDPKFDVVYGQTLEGGFIGEFRLFDHITDWVVKKFDQAASHPFHSTGQNFTYQISVGSEWRGSPNVAKSQLLFVNVGLAVKVWGTKHGNRRNAVKSE